MSSSSDPATESSQAASTSYENAKPTPKQNDLRKNRETEKDTLLGLYWKREYGMLFGIDSYELKQKEVKKKKFESQLKVAENNRL